MKLKKNGFTLIELIIVTLIGIVLIYVVLDALGGLSATDSRSRKEQDLLAARDTIITELEREIKWAEKVTVNPNGLQIDKGSDKKTYRVNNFKFVKQSGPDRQDLTTDKVKVDEFIVNNYSANSEYALVEIKVRIYHANEIPKKEEMEFSATIAQRKSKI